MVRPFGGEVNQAAAGEGDGMIAMGVAPVEGIGDVVATEEEGCHGDEERGGEGEGGGADEAHVRWLDVLVGVGFRAESAVLASARGGEYTTRSPSRRRTGVSDAPVRKRSRMES